VDVCSVVPSAWPGCEERMCEAAVNAAEKMLLRGWGGRPVLV